MDNINVQGPTTVTVSKRGCFLENREVRGGGGFVDNSANADAANWAGAKVEEEEEVRHEAKA